VQADQKWKPETVAALGAGLLFSVSIGMLLALAVRKLVPGLPDSKAQFYASVLSNFSFQGMAILFTFPFLQSNGRSWTRFLGLDAGRFRPIVARAVLVTVLALPMALLLRAGCEALLTALLAPTEMQPALQIIQLSASPGQLAYTGFMAIVIAPAAEEIVFRGILYQAIKERGWPRTGLFGTSLLFGAIHGHLPSFIALSFLGLVFAKLYDRTGSLFAPIFGHSLFNAVNFSLFLATQNTAS